MAIKRIVVEVSPIERPFKEGETLFSYAQRILREESPSSVAVNISANVRVADVSTYDKREYICVEETFEITARPEEMAR